MLNEITPLILTFNEAPNIARTLEQLRWARQIYVVDSFSTDATLAIVRSFSNTHVVQRAFDRFETQWNHGLFEINIQSEWVLALDADYVLSPALVAELATLRPSDDVAGYWARFQYCIDGVALRASLYPPVAVLFRRQRARFVQDGHAYRVQVNPGRLERLRGPILHDDRKSLSRWLISQERYATEEAHKLITRGWAELSWPDRIRRVPFLAAPLVGVHCLLAKGCLLDGRAGLKYTGQRIVAELVISLKLLEHS